jgi:hypothetical protein
MHRRVPTTAAAPNSPSAPNVKHTIDTSRHANLLLAFGFRVYGLGSGVCGSEFGFEGLGFGVWGLGFRVWGLEFGVWDWGFRV